MTDLNPMLLRIKKLKQEKNYTNEQLSDETGIPKSTLGKLLSGAIKEPPATSVVKIAKVLGTSADYLVSGKNAPRSEGEPFAERYLTLNAEGRKKADDYIELLCENPRYCLAAQNAQADENADENQNTTENKKAAAPYNTDAEPFKKAAEEKISVNAVKTGIRHT